MIIIRVFSLKKNTMETTHVFNLLSGVECEVKELTGKHQKMLTAGSKDFEKKLSAMLSDVIVRIGDERQIDEEFIKGMLSCDKKKALVEIRQFSLGFEETFSFTYDYRDLDNTKQTHEVNVHLEDGNFPSRTVKREGEEGLVDADYTDYADVLENKDKFITLPRSGKEVRFTMLDGRGEAIGSAAKKADRSSHTLLKMRRPVYFHKKEGGNEAVPIQLDLDELSYMDIEHLRKEIKLHEGFVDTEIVFEHPNSELGEDDLREDVLGITAFFFPSEAL